MEFGGSHTVHLSHLWQQHEAQQQNISKPKITTVLHNYG